MRLGTILLFGLLAIGCGEEILPVSDPAQNQGEKTLAAAFMAQDIVRDQLDALSRSAAPDLPPVLLPEVKVAVNDSLSAITQKFKGAEAKAQFHGPVVGPDGAEAW